MGGEGFTPNWYLQLHVWYEVKAYTSHTPSQNIMIDDTINSVTWHVHKLQRPDTK